MRRCDNCGHEYAKTFEVTKDDRVYTFHSLECAAVALAKRCACCGSRLVFGYGAEARSGSTCEACAALSRVAG